LPKVIEDLPDYLGVFDAGNHLHYAGAFATGLNVDIANTLEALRSGHRRSHRTESHHPVRALDVHPVEEQHVQVDVEVERTTEALDQSDRAGSSRLVSVVSFSDQMRGNDTLDDTQHATGDLGPAGEQET
jgi:hypothetical protein